MRKIDIVWNDILLRYPALVCALLVAIGISMRYSPSPDLLIPLAALLFPLIFGGRIGSIAIALTTCAAAYLLAASYAPELPNLNSPKPGLGYFEISEVKNVSSPFSRSTIWKGKMKTFVSEDGKRLRNLPCNVHFKSISCRPSANHHYWIEGNLKGGPNYYSIKVNDRKKLLAGNSVSVAEKRYKIKQLIQKKIHKVAGKESIGEFLTGLATGNTCNRELLFALEKCGLSHLLSVSGFHFALVLALFVWLFRPLLMRKSGLFILLLILLTYNCYIGSSPAIFRAWVVASLYVIAKMTGREAGSLNFLGIALLLQLLINPLSILSPGLLYSFTATAGILLLFEPIQKSFDKLFPKQTYFSIYRKSLWDKHIYLAGRHLLDAISLTLAVSLVTIPIAIFFRGEFPILAIIYNLFTPPIVGLIYLCTLLSLLCPPLLYPAKWLAKLTLIPILNAPVHMQYYIQFPELPRFALLTLYSLLFSSALYKKSFRDDELNRPQNFIQRLKLTRKALLS